MMFESAERKRLVRSLLSLLIIVGSALLCLTLYLLYGLGAIFSMVVILSLGALIIVSMHQENGILAGQSIMGQSSLNEDDRFGGGEASPPQGPTGGA